VPLAVVLAAMALIPAMDDMQDWRGWGPRT
jgi:hypothetical protein